MSRLSYPPIPYLLACRTDGARLAQDMQNGTGMESRQSADWLLSLLGSQWPDADKMYITADHVRDRPGGGGGMSLSVADRRIMSRRRRSVGRADTAGR